MKLTSLDLLSIIDTGLVRKIAEYLAEQLSDFEKEWENLDINEKQQQAHMYLLYNEAVEIYNSCSALKIEKLNLPKTESWKTITNK